MPRPEVPAVSRHEAADSAVPCHPVQPGFLAEAPQYSPDRTCAARHIPRQASGHTLDASPQLAAPFRRCQSAGTEHLCQPSPATQRQLPNKESTPVAVTDKSGSGAHASALSLLLAESQEASAGTDRRSVKQAAAGLARPSKVAHRNDQGRAAQQQQQQREAILEIIPGPAHNSKHHPEQPSPDEPDVSTPDDCLALLLSFFSKEEADDEDDGRELLGGHAESVPVASDVTWQGSHDTWLDNCEGLTPAADSAGYLAPASVPISVISAKVECLGCDARRLSGSCAPPVTGACSAALAVAAAAAAAAVSAAGGAPGAATVTVTNDCEGLPQWLPASPFLPTLSPFLASLDHDEVEALALSSEGTELLPLDAGALDDGPEFQAHDSEGPYGSLQEAWPYQALSSPPAALCSNRTLSTISSGIGFSKGSTSGSSMDDTWAHLPSAPQQASARGDQPGTAVVRLDSVASSSTIAAWCHAQPGAHSKLGADPGPSLGWYTPVEPGRPNGTALGDGRVSQRTQAETLYLINPLVASSQDPSAARGLSPDAWVAVMGCYELPLDKHKGGDAGWASPSGGITSTQGLLCPGSASGKQKRRRESSVQAEEGERQGDRDGQESGGRESEGEGESGESENDKEQEEEWEEEEEGQRDSQGEDEGAEASFDLNVLFKSVEQEQWEQRGPGGDAQLSPPSTSGGTGHLPGTSCQKLCAVTDRLLHTNGTFHTRLEVHVHRLKSPDEFQSLLPATHHPHHHTDHAHSTNAPLEGPTPAQPGHSDSRPRNVTVHNPHGNGNVPASVDVHSEAGPSGVGAKPPAKIRRAPRGHLEERSCHVILHTQRSTQDWLHRLGMGTARMAGRLAAVERGAEGGEGAPEGAPQEGSGVAGWKGGDAAQDPSPEAVDRQSYTFPRYSPTFMTMLLAEYNCQRSKDGFRLCHSSFSATLDQNKLAGAARAARQARHPPAQHHPHLNPDNATSDPKASPTGGLEAPPGRTQAVPAPLLWQEGERHRAERAQGSRHKSGAVFECLEDALEAVSPSPKQQLHTSFSAQFGAQNEHHHQHQHQHLDLHQNQWQHQCQHQSQSQQQQQNGSHPIAQQPPTHHRSGGVHPWPAQPGGRSKQAQGEPDPFPLPPQARSRQPGHLPGSFLAQAGRSDSEPLGSPENSPLLSAVGKRPSLQLLSRPSAPAGSVRHSQSDSRLLARSLPPPQEVAQSPREQDAVPEDSVAQLLRQGSESLQRAESGAPSSASARSSASLQRERSGKIQLMDLAKHFHLPINDAAKALGICPTVLKKICRRHGMRRWPHRKIRSLDRIIATLEETVEAGGGTATATESLVNEIKALKREKELLCAGNLGSL